MRRTSVTTCLGLSLALSVAPLPADHDTHGEAATAKAPPIFDGLGDYSRKVSKIPMAQSYFDQGLRLCFGFNLEEGERSFREAARLDPGCALCAWGIAFALGPHINVGALPERTAAAAREVAKAMPLAAHAAPVERALLEALAKRYSDPAPANPEGQSALDTAYAEAMRDVARRFPDDADVQYLAAEALMDLHPWDLYEPSGAPKAWTPEIVGILERSLAKAPEHPGLNHLYIHAVEASSAPERAVASADRLRTAVPAAGHLVHMPAHIYQRVGRYADASLANERAIAADNIYLVDAGPNQFYPMYVAHNHQFLWFAAQMEGRSATAYTEAKNTVALAPVEMMRMIPGLDGTLGYPVWTLIRFGRYGQALKEPLPTEEFPYATGVAYAARAIAFARTGHADEAVSERASAAAAFAKLAADSTEGFNPAPKLGELAIHLADGEIAGASGESDVAVEHLRSAVAIEDTLRYDEPADWYFPTRHLLGRELLDADRAKEAEAVFREDLARNRENGWALAGIAESLRRQGKAAEAADFEKRLAAAWPRADLGLTRIAAPPARTSSTRR